MQVIEFELRGEFIALDALLKATGIAESGGAAKALVAGGAVRVDGEPEARKTRKVRAAQVVVVQPAGVEIRVNATGG